MSSYRQLRYRAILNEANPSYSREEIDKKWTDILKNGVFLKDKKLFYWLDVDPSNRDENKEVGTKRNEKGVDTKPAEMNDCYVVLASSLTFTDRYDNWKREYIPPPDIVVMNLSDKVRWLEVKGDFSTVKLQAYRNYNVSFLVKVNKNHQDFPSNGLQLELSYVIPNANRSETRCYKITAAHHDKWIELNAGTFYHWYFTLGTIYFSMKNTDATWKAGISVLGVCIKPATGEGSDRINPAESITNKILRWEKYHYNK